MSPRVCLTFFFCLALDPASVPAAEAGADRYVFAWPFIDAGEMAPRGGTSSGPPVRLLAEPTDAWGALREPGIDKKERDRRAILAMAGPYRASFDFLETVGFDAGFEPARPYRSWGTEFVYVVADEPDFISLQHVMVMFFEADDGSVSEPVAIKHWRQDWTYEDRDLHVFTGHGRWARRRLGADEAEGRWSQAVYQVDDSPRYEAAGVWVHTEDYSLWESGETWRPLPRREFSVRDDYDVLVGTNRHTILPDGWVHEEDNVKVTLPETGQGGERRALAREAGVNRYQRIAGHDWSAGDDYWARMAPFWQEVRMAWTDVFAARDEFRLRRQVEGRPLFIVMFDLAHRTTEGAFDREAARAEIDAVLDDFLAR